MRLFDKFAKELFGGGASTRIPYFLNIYGPLYSYLPSYSFFAYFLVWYSINIFLGLLTPERTNRTNGSSKQGFEKEVPKRNQQVTPHWTGGRRAWILGPHQETISATQTPTSRPVRDSAARWHLRKILRISRIAIPENLEGFFWQYGYRFAGKDNTYGYSLHHQ